MTGPTVTDGDNNGDIKSLFLAARPQDILKVPHAISSAKIVIGEYGCSQNSSSSQFHYESPSGDDLRTYVQDRGEQGVLGA